MMTSTKMCINSEQTQEATKANLGGSEKYRCGRPMMLDLR